MNIFLFSKIGSVYAAAIVFISVYVITIGDHHYRRSSSLDMLSWIPIKLDKFFPSLSETHSKHLVIEIDLHILMSLLELSDGNFLSLVEIRGIGQPSSILTSILPIVHIVIAPPTCHAFHIEDCVRVDYCNYGNYDKTGTSWDEKGQFLTSPGVKYHEKESGEHSQLQYIKNDMLPLIMDDSELLVICEAKYWEECVENAWFISVLFKIKTFFEIVWLFSCNWSFIFGYLAINDIIFILTFTKIFCLLLSNEVLNFFALVLFDFFDNDSDSILNTLRYTDI